MLDIVTKSKTRKKILRFLFFNENKKFYLSEIAKKTDVSVGNAQRELKKMLDFSIIKTEKVGNMRFYFVNQQNHLYKELRNIIKSTIGIEDEIRQSIYNIQKINFAFIFGSYVKGNFREDSDIDLVFIGSPDEDELIKKINILEKLIAKPINYHVYKKQEFQIKIKKDSFLKNIIKDYLLLKGNQDEFRKIFK